MGDKLHKMEQKEKLMNGRGKANGALEDDSFKKFLFNKERGSCLGRTAKSWFQILGFYVIFYTCLVGFWIGCLAIFLHTLDDKVPRYYGKGTIIGVNPGVGYQPWLIENPDSTLIKFNIQDKQSYAKYVEALDKYLEKYTNLTATRVCTGDESNAQLFPHGGAKAQDLSGSKIIEACRFDLAQFKEAQCDKNTDYGFAAGKPCVVLSLNRLIGWKPVDYASDSVPEAIRDRYKPNFVTFNCDGNSDFDKEHIGNITYIPEAGIDAKYYPYAVMPNYQQPIAMVKFNNLPRNKLVLIECQAYAQNIEVDMTSKLGMVNFELLLQDMELDRPVEQTR